MSRPGFTAQSLRGRAGRIFGLAPKKREFRGAHPSLGVVPGVRAGHKRRLAQRQMEGARPLSGQDQDYCDQGH